MKHHVLFGGILLASLFFVQCMDNNLEETILKENASQETRLSGFKHYPNYNIILNQQKYRMEELWELTKPPIIEKPAQHGSTKIKQTK